MTIPGHPEPFQCQMDAGKTVVVCTTTWLTGGSDNGTTSLSVSLKKAASYSSADLVGDWDCNSLATGPGEPWWERATIILANPDAVSLEGGFNADFSATPGWTTVTGTVTISGGPVTVENIAIL